MSCTCKKPILWNECEECFHQSPDIEPRCHKCLGDLSKQPTEDFESQKLWFAEGKKAERRAIVKLADGMMKEKHACEHIVPTETHNSDGTIVYCCSDIHIG